MTYTIRTKDIERMVLHWLNTPVGGYLGSNYGVDAYAYVHLPMSSANWDAFIEKMKVDLPVLAIFGNEINIIQSNLSNEKKQISILLGRDIEIDISDVQAN
jgi:hypothetical protein